MYLMSAKIALLKIPFRNVFFATGGAFLEKQTVFQSQIESRLQDGVIFSRRNGAREFFIPLNIPERGVLTHQTKVSGGGQGCIEPF